MPQRPGLHCSIYCKRVFFSSPTILVLNGEPLVVLDGFVPTVIGSNQWKSHNDMNNHYGYFVVGFILRVYHYNYSERKKNVKSNAINTSRMWSNINRWFLFLIKIFQKCIPINWYVKTGWSGQSANWQQILWGWQKLCRKIQNNKVVNINLYWNLFSMVLLTERNKMKWRMKHQWQATAIIIIIRPFVISFAKNCGN